LVGISDKDSEKESSLAHYTKGNENFLLVAALEGCQGLVDCNRSKTEYEDEFEYEDD